MDLLDDAEDEEDQTEQAEDMKCEENSADLAERQSAKRSHKSEEAQMDAGDDATTKKTRTDAGTGMVAVLGQDAAGCAHATTRTVTFAPDSKGIMQETHEKRRLEENEGGWTQVPSRKSPRGQGKGPASKGEQNDENVGGDCAISADSHEKSWRQEVQVNDDKSMVLKIVSTLMSSPSTPGDVLKALRSVLKKKAVSLTINAPAIRILIYPVENDDERASVAASVREIVGPLHFEITTKAYKKTRSSPSNEGHVVAESRGNTNMQIQAAAQQTFVLKFPPIARKEVHTLFRIEEGMVSGEPRRRFLTQDTMRMTEFVKVSTQEHEKIQLLQRAVAEGVQYLESGNPVVVEELKGAKEVVGVILTGVPQGVTAMLVQCCLKDVLPELAPLYVEMSSAERENGTSWNSRCAVAQYDDPQKAHRLMKIKSIPCCGGFIVPAPGFIPTACKACANCGQKGHSPHECSEKKVCICCGQEGHIARNCPKSNAPPQTSAWVRPLTVLQKQQRVWKRMDNIELEGAGKPVAKVNARGMMEDQMAGRSRSVPHITILKRQERTDNQQVQQAPPEQIRQMAAVDEMAAQVSKVDLSKEEQTTVKDGPAEVKEGIESVVRELQRTIQEQQQAIMQMLVKIEELTRIIGKLQQGKESHVQNMEASDGSDRPL